MVIVSVEKICLGQLVEIRLFLLNLKIDPTPLFLISKTHSCLANFLNQTQISKQTVAYLTNLLMISTHSFSDPKTTIIEEYNEEEDQMEGNENIIR